ncbi:MAG: hypothetical protein NTZ69_16645 [Bacteroidia bacterium]|nr:hypothetical protein [Bacteroidia bacterium]
MTINYKIIFQILLRSFKEAFNWNLWKWLSTIGIGLILSAIPIGKELFEWDTKREIKFVIATILILYLFRFLAIFLKESLKYFHETYRNSVFGEAIIVLKDSFANTHFYRKTPGHDDTEFMKIMITFCNNLEFIYNKITQSECSVSIKVPRYDPTVHENTVLMNLTRDITHNSRDTQTYCNTKHTLIGNTAFTFSFNQVMNNTKEKHYIHNAINDDPKYLNTSKDCYKDGILPYNSELVVPIVPVVNNKVRNYDCLGFLCVDCSKKNAFMTKYEVALLEGVADGIYDLISERNIFNNKSNTVENGK